MKIFNSPIITKKYKGSAIAIGNFDGVHKGHQKVFSQAKKFAKKNSDLNLKKQFNLRILVVSKEVNFFDKHDLVTLTFNVLYFLKIKMSNF